MSPPSSFFITRKFPTRSRSKRTKGEGKTRRNETVAPLPRGHTGANRSKQTQTQPAVAKRDSLIQVSVVSRVVLLNNYNTTSRLIY